MRKEQRIKYSDHNFRKYILPILQLKYSGIWSSTEKLKIDYKNCIDWIYVPNVGKPVFIASRVWMSRPFSNHCVRYKKSTDMDAKLEVDIMLDNMRQNRLLPDYTIESWVYDSHIYIAISETIKLWTYIKNNLEDIPTIQIKNPVGYTLFKKIDFAVLDYEPYKITIPDFFSEDESRPL